MDRAADREGNEFCVLRPKRTTIASVQTRGQRGAGCHRSRKLKTQEKAALPCRSAGAGEELMLLDIVQMSALPVGHEDGGRVVEHLRISESAGGELGDDGGGVDPHLLAAHQTVAESEDVEDAEADRAAVAGDAEHLADHLAGHLLLEHERVVGDDLVQRAFALGAEVGGEEAVELPGGVLALPRRAGEPDGVVDDVVGVDGDGALDIAGALRLQVALDQRPHLGDIHCPLSFVDLPTMGWHTCNAMTLSRQEEHPRTAPRRADGPTSGPAPAPR